jgi:hypothetical protein
MQPAARQIEELLVHCVSAIDRLDALRYEKGPPLRCYGVDHCVPLRGGAAREFGTQYTAPPASRPVHGNIWVYHAADLWKEAGSWRTGQNFGVSFIALWATCRALKRLSSQSLVLARRVISRKVPRVPFASRCACCRYHSTCIPGSVCQSALKQALSDWASDWGSDRSAHWQMIPLQWIAQPQVAGPGALPGLRGPAAGDRPQPAQGQAGVRVDPAGHDGPLCRRYQPAGTEQMALWLRRLRFEGLFGKFGILSSILSSRIRRHIASHSRCNRGVPSLKVACPPNVQRT